jgi:4-hydroxy-2-oxoheptanedioate aldolase
VSTGVNPTNTVKEKLAAGERVIGCFIPLASPEIVEMCALTGFDFALLDAEHGPLSPESAYPMVLAGEARGIEVFARVGQADKQMVLKFLDIGVSGVMAPQVNTIEQANAAVDGTKYYPTGNRGLAGGRTFDYGMGAPLVSMVEPLNDRVLTMVQFEHVDALKDLDAILALEQLDVLFVGPNDLAQSLGFPGQPGHPEVTRVADEAIARAKAAGKKTGTVAYSMELVSNAFERGFDMTVASATGLFAGAAKAYVDGVRKMP